MANEDMTRSTVMVSKQTDSSLRSFMSVRGMQEGALSRFIEEALKWRVFDQMLGEAREKFADLPPDDLQALIEEATSSVRTGCRLPPYRKHPDPCGQ
jgi:hypothetical protein